MRIATHGMTTETAIVVVLCLLLLLPPVLLEFVDSEEDGSNEVDDRVVVDARSVA